MLQLYPRATHGSQLWHVGRDLWSRHWWNIEDERIIFMNKYNMEKKVAVHLVSK